MSAIKKPSESGGNWTAENNANGIIPRLCQNIKPDFKTTAIITCRSHKINGYSTRLLQLRPDTFKLERHGLRHVSGMYFLLDCMNLQAAKNFLQGACNEL